MGKIKSDKIFVVGLEACCWEDCPSGEIIEIGICSLDIRSREIGDVRSYIIKPRIDGVSDYCTALTGYTQKDVDGGISLEKAVKLMKRDLGTETRQWASWGYYDRDHIDNECRFKGIENPMSHAHINVKMLFSAVVGKKKTFGMGRALSMAGMEFEGSPHKGVDDAVNAARVLRWCLWERQNNG